MRSVMVGFGGCGEAEEEREREGKVSVVVVDVRRSERRVMVGLRIGWWREGSGGGCWVMEEAIEESSELGCS